MKKIVNDLINCMTEAYYEKRDIEQLMSCVTDDVVWIGTEYNEFVKGKEALRRLLEKEIKKYPKAFAYKIKPPYIHFISDNVCVASIDGEKSADGRADLVYGVRGSICCVKNAQGWLINNVHTSVPNEFVNRYNLEQKLLDEYKKQETLLAGIPGGIAIYRLKKNGKVSTDYVSESLARMCDYSATEFLEYLKDNAVVNLVEDDKPKVIQALQEALRDNKMLSVYYRIYKKNHDIIHIKLDANIITNVKMAADDVVVLYAVHSILSDDARRSLEEQQRCRMILDNLGVAYLDYEEGGEVYTSEQYSRYAVSMVDSKLVVANKGPLDTIHPDDLPKLMKFYNMKKSRVHKEVVTLRCKMMDGSYRWTEMFGFYEYDNDGRLTRQTGIFRDVEKEWEEQNRHLQEALEIARKANEAKTIFLSTVSHDMRTPLNGILGLTHLMLNRVHDEQLRQDLTQLENSGHYLLNLINDTLDVNKIESGKMKLNPAVCDGKSMINSILSLLKPGIDEKGINLVMHIGALPYTKLYIDMGRMEQVIINVVSNAVKFTPYGGTIDFYMDNLSVKDGIITDRVIVKDNGIGMSREFLPHVFEPFQQENNGNTTKYKGTGLGMTITKKIIQLMGGDISIESELGKGTAVTFTICMPIATPEQVAKAKLSQLNNTDTVQLSGKRILLCEDHPLNAQIAKRMLESRGMLIEHAENGRIGVEIFEASENGYFDAVLMDIRMPEMDGFKATEMIRTSKHPQAAAIPIIAMTANAFDTDIQASFAIGMNAHLSKPIEPQKLFEALEVQLMNMHCEDKREILKKTNISLLSSIIVVGCSSECFTMLEAGIADAYRLIKAANGEGTVELLKKETDVRAVIINANMGGMSAAELIKRLRAERKYQYVGMIAIALSGDAEQEERLLNAGADDFIYAPTRSTVVKKRLENVMCKFGTM